MVEQPFFIPGRGVAECWKDDQRETGMLKKDIVDKVSMELGQQKQDIGLAVDIILETMAEALKEGRRIELRGFGTFSTRARKPRNTRNPRTGVVMDIPERKTLHFTMSKSLKEALISGKD